ncbi:tyrosine-type recombinase/integrase [Fusobacterium necrophorum subsp. funduliforme]
MKNPNGMGTVYRLKGNRRKAWVASKTIKWEIKNGKVTQERIVIGTYSTKMEAMQALARCDIEKKLREKEVISFREIFDKWFQSRKDKLSERTLQVYISMYNVHLEQLSDENFKELKYEEWQEFINSVSSKTSAHLIKAILKGIYSYAMKMEIVDRDYSNLIEIGKAERKVHRRVFTEEEIKILWKHTKDKYVKGTIILLFTGLRIGELLKVEKEKVFYEERYFITGSKTTTGKNRIIPIHNEILPIIKELLETDGKYLIGDENGKKIKYDDFRKHFNKFLKEFGIEEHTLQDTRHTFISMMDTIGANKVIMTKIVGHKHVETSEKVYTHKKKEQLVSEVNKLKY